MQDHLRTSISATLSHRIDADVCAVLSIQWISYPVALEPVARVRCVKRSLAALICISSARYIQREERGYVAAAAAAAALC